MRKITVVSRHAAQTKKKARDKRKRDPRGLSRPVTTLAFVVCPRRTLYDAGIRTVGQLANRTAADLRAIKGIGPKSVDEVMRVLRGLGLSLKTARAAA